MIEINNKKVDLNLLSVFYKIFECQSVSKAASELDISQSAVSHSLKKLRVIFSDELFIRYGNKIIPTTKAQKIFLNLKPLMETLRENIYQEMGFNPSRSSRKFNIAMADITEIILLPRILKYMLASGFNIQIKTFNVSPLDIATYLNEGMIDIAIGSFKNVDENLYSKRLFEHEFVAISHKKSELSARRLSRDEYLSKNHIIVSSSSDEVFSHIALESIDLSRKMIMQVSHYLSLPWLLYNNDCVATVPAGLSKILSESIPLDIHQLKWFDNDFHVDMLWSARVNKDPSIYWLVNLIYDLSKDIRDKNEKYQNIFEYVKA